MGTTSRTLSLTLGILLVMAAAHPRFAHALMQEPNATGAGKPASPTDGSSQPTTPPDERPEGKVAPVQVADQAKQTRGSGQTAVGNDGGKDQKSQTAGTGGSAKSAKTGGSKGKSQPAKGTTKRVALGPSPIHDAASQIIESLDVAISLAQKAGTLEPNPLPSTQASDIRVQRDQLQKKLRAAKDDNDWAGVAADAAGILADTVRLMETKSGNLATSGQTDSGRVRMNDETASQAASREPFFRSRQLPLYVAGLSLVLSVLGLSSGWLLARREINKALIEAGLL